MADLVYERPLTYAPPDPAEEGAPAKKGGENNEGGEIDPEEVE